MQKWKVLLLHKHRVFYLRGRSILAAFHPLQFPQRRIEIHIFQQVIRRVDKVTGRPDLPVAMPRVAAPISFRLQVGNHMLNVYANYDMQRQQVCDELEITLYGSGIEEHSLTYHLNAAEKEVLCAKMETYCMEQEHTSLTQFCKEILQDQDAPAQEMQM